MPQIMIHEISAIRKAVAAIGARYSKAKRFKINSSTRVNIDTGKIAMNIMEITTDEDWNDTDLYDNSYPFDKFTEHLGTLPALFDFWVYEPHPDDKDDHGDLVTNAQAKFPGNGTVEIWDGDTQTAVIQLKSC